MQTILDQSAIDAMFASQAPEIGAGSSVASSSLYNFGRAGQISNEQMRAISTVNDYFARNVMHTLGAWLRTQIRVVLAAGEQMPYGEFLSRVPEPAYICMLRLEPLGGVGLLEIDLKLALTMVDLLLGGRGGADVARDLTDIEDAILVSVMEVIVRELNSAWDKVGLQFSYDKRDHDGRVPRLMSSGERTLCVSFEMEMMGVTGMLNFCLPAVVLNTIHRRLLATNEEPRPIVAATAGRIAALMGGAKFCATLRMPAVRIPSCNVRALKPGTVLELPLPKHTQAELILGGVRLCSAGAVARGGLRGALIGSTVQPSELVDRHGGDLETEGADGAAVGESV